MRFKALLLKPFKALWNSIRSVWQKFTDLMRSNSQVLANSSLIEKVVLYTFAVGYGICLFYWPLNPFVVAFGVAINTYFMNQIVNLRHLKLNPIGNDILSPLLGVVIFGFSVWLYLLVPEVTILLSLFSIPQVIKDFKEKVVEYDEALLQIEEELYN